MVKVRQKISGSMRTLTGAEHFCHLRSYLTTAGKHGINLLDALIQPASVRHGYPRSTDLIGYLLFNSPPLGSRCLTIISLIQFRTGVGLTSMTRQMTPVHCFSDWSLLMYLPI